MSESDIIKKRTEDLLCKFLSDPNPDLSTRVLPPFPESIVCQQCIMPTLVSYQVSRLPERKHQLTTIVQPGGIVLFEKKETNNIRGRKPVVELNCSELGDQIRTRPYLRHFGERSTGRALPDTSLSASAPCTRKLLK